MTRDFITTEHAALLVALADFGAKFRVVAGKYDGDEENCKFVSDTFDTYDEAVAELATVLDYPWSRIEITHDELNALRMRSSRGAQAPAARPHPAAFADYASYVGACRAHARVTRQRVVSYLPRGQWAAERAAQA